MTDIKHASPIRLRPAADVLSRVRNQAANLADCARRQNQHPDPVSAARYTKALEAFEAACDAAYAEAHLANTAVQRAVGEAARRPDRLGALLTPADALDPNQKTKAMGDLHSALRPFIQARTARSA